MPFGGQSSLSFPQSQTKRSVSYDTQSPCFRLLQYRRNRQNGNHDRKHCELSTIGENVPSICEKLIGQKPMRQCARFYINLEWFKDRSHRASGSRQLAGCLLLIASAAQGNILCAESSLPVYTRRHGDSLGVV